MPDDDTPDLSQYHGYPRQEPAQHPEGLEAPIHDQPKLIEPIWSFEELKCQTRRLMRLSRNPYNDPLWAELRPQWEDWEAYLSRLIKSRLKTEPTTHEEMSEEVWGLLEQLGLCRTFLLRAQ